MDDFLTRAILGGLGLALLTGPLGAVLVWRRMAYFGAALAHSALLGVALGLVLGIDINLATLLVCVLVAFSYSLLERRRWLASDTVLGIIAHATLALGLVVLALIQGPRADPMAYLFGDILAITRIDLAWIFGGGALVLAALVLTWRPLLALTVHADLARVEGRPVALVAALYTLLLALAIAVAMKIVGALLITSLLIIPAAAARRVAATPERMAVLASLLGMAGVLGGIAVSWWTDTPTGPTIVLVVTAIFVVLALLPRGAAARS
jgi:zinc transport system permease protein